MVQPAPRLSTRPPAYHANDLRYLPDAFESPEPAPRPSPASRRMTHSCCRHLGIHHLLSLPSPLTLLGILPRHEQLFHRQDLPRYLLPRRTARPIPDTSPLMPAAAWAT